MYDVVIIGAGIIGSSIFRELTRYDLKVAVIEKENDVSMGTTKANSAIVHAGFDPEYGSLAGKYNVKGNQMFEKICQELDVPFKKNGSMVIAFTDEDVECIERLYENGNKLGVKGLKILTKEETLSMEPNLNNNIKGSLYAPNGGIVCPFQFTIALCENAVINGGEIKLNKEVISIKKDSEFIIKTKDGDIIRSKYIINAAGVFSDKIHNMICKEKFKINPRLGEYFVLDKSQGNLFKHTIFQCPSKKGKGVLITPTVHGNILVGPDAVDIDDKNDKSTTISGLDTVRKVAQKSSDKINFKYNIRNFAGIRAIASSGDFIVEENEDVKGFVDVAGMKSPGLSCAPAIALDVIEILNKAGLKLNKKKNFIAERKQLRFMELSEKEKSAIIKRNPRFGRIICRCESITEGEIVDSIHRCFAVPTIDAIKRRCRPGMGRCQGGFCSPKVQEIIAKECNVKMENVLLDKDGSRVLFGKTK